MKLTILGSGTGLPRANRNAPGYLLEIGKNLIMLDAGEGTKRQIVKAGYDFFKLSHIFITHTHVDHTAEIPAILWPFIWGTKKAKKLKIFGPPRFKQFFNKISKTFIPTIDSAKLLKIEVKELKNNNIKVNQMKVVSKIMPGRTQAHTFSPYEVGYRITHKSKSIVFCGDNISKDEPYIVDLAHNCDLLILESAKPKSDSAHLGPETAGRIAQSAGAKKLVLTHFYPEVEKVNIKKLASKYYQGPIILAKDLMQIKI